MKKVKKDFVKQQITSHKSKISPNNLANRTKSENR